jgi:hypothetical protein
MHKDAKKIARRIDDAFAALREQGFFAKANHTCCQSCGLADIPADKEMAYVFYHMQDAEGLKQDGACYLAWGGCGQTICTALREQHLEVDWNGSEHTRIAVTGLESSTKKWDVTIVQTSIVTSISAKTEQEAIRKARDDASWSDHVVDVQTIASAS